jgi:hypothetical protein
MPEEIEFRGPEVSLIEAVSFQCLRKFLFSLQRTYGCASDAAARVMPHIHHGLITCSQMHQMLLNGGRSVAGTSTNWLAFALFLADIHFLSQWRVKLPKTAQPTAAVPQSQ